MQSFEITAESSEELQRLPLGSSPSKGPEQQQGRRRGTGSSGRAMESLLDPESRVHLFSCRTENRYGLMPQAGSMINP